MPICCYCKEPIIGEPRFCIPEGFPLNSDHDGKPLCDGCGGSPVQSLNQICQFLDNEAAAPPSPQENDAADMAAGIISMLLALPTDEAREDVLGLVFEKICKSCYRPLANEEICYCWRDE